MVLQRSPNIKFKIKFCAKCNLEINKDSEEIKCDSCKMDFHKECSNNNPQANGTIWICVKCNKIDEICNNRDQFEIKTANFTTNSQLQSKAIVNLDRMDTKNFRDGLRNGFEVKLIQMELKMAELERRLQKSEKNECKCSKKVESLATLIEKGMLSQQSKSKTATSLDENVIAQIESLANEISSINEKINSCEAICDTNITMGIEIQKHIDDINSRLNDAGKNKQTNSPTQPIGVTNQAITEIANAIKRHNSTIKTHFKLSEAYNLDVLEKINRAVCEMNKISGHKQHSNHGDISEISKKRAPLRSSNIVACEIGKLSVRPLHNRQRTCKQIRIHIYDCNCDSTGDVHKFLSNILAMYSSVITENNIKWFTTKIVFDQATHHIKRINLIAELPEEIDTNSLTILMKRVFEFERGSNTRDQTDKR